MAYAHTISNRVYRFADLTTLLAKATPERSGDQLAGIAAESDKERMAARVALADLPLRTFLDEQIVPYEVDEVTRLIVDTHDAPAFAPIAHLTVGGWRDWLLSEHATPDALAALAPGLTPEMVAAVSKLMRNQDLIVVARKCRVVTRFRNTLGLPGRLDRVAHRGHELDGLCLDVGDAVIGINPASDSTAVLGSLVKMLAEVIERYEIPTQSCVLTHVTNTMRMIEAGVPVDLVFQSVAGTEQANKGFGINLALLREANDAARAHIHDDHDPMSTLGRRPSSCRSTNARGEGLRGRTRVRAIAGQHGRRLHRARVPVQRQADHPRRTRRPLLRQAPGPADRL